MRPKDVTGLYGPICSIPALPTHTPLFIPGMTDFDAYTSEWGKRISTTHDYALVPKSPIRAMFTAFKDFYIELSALMPKVTCITGRNAFLHLARVARENDDVQAMRNLRNDLIACWNTYLDEEERKKEKMNKRLGRMLDVDIYPASEWEEEKNHGNVSEDEKQRKQAQQEAMHAGMQAQKAQQRFQQQQFVQKAHQQRGIQVLAYQQQQAQQKAMQQSMIMQQHAQQQQALQARMQLQQQVQQRASQVQSVGCSMNVQLPSVSPMAGVVAPDANGQVSYLDFEELGENDGEEEVGEAGPGPSSSSSSSSSSKKRRVDSGFSEVGAEAEGEERTWLEGRIEDFPAGVTYVGKGKGRMGEPEVICLD
jgi:hypothetical protein